MTPLLLSVSTKLTRRYFAGAILAAVLIVSLPIMGVAAFGKNTLIYLNGVTTSNSGLYQGPDVPGDTYAWGNCTYWAYAMRYWANDPIPTSWGNANTWASRAIDDGYVVDHKPSVGAVFQTTDGSLGHVAYVTKVNSAGNWTISEMNAPNFDVVSTRTFEPSAAAYYNFIHDKRK